MVVEVRESDAAKCNFTTVSAFNRKAIKLSGKDNGWVLSVHALCLLHQLYLVVGIMLDSIQKDVNLLSSMHAVAAFFRYQGNVDVILTQVEKVVRDHTIIRRTGVPDCSFRPLVLNIASALVPNVRARPPS